MDVVEVTMNVPAPKPGDLFGFYKHVAESDPERAPVRFVINGFRGGQHACNVGMLSGVRAADVPSIFDLKQRPFRRSGPFTVVHVIPTGVGAKVGGHSGDGAPVAQLLGATCDRLILHPNVVNASDLNEMPSNALYVEGSSIARLLMGTIGLRARRANRVGVVIVEPPGDALLADDAVNGVSAGCASGGVPVSRIIRVKNGFEMDVRFTADGRASGHVSRFEVLDAIVREHRGAFDALAISSPMDIPDVLVDDYFAKGAAAVNPIGGLEALLTHGISLVHGIPTAHSPLLPSFRGRGLVEPSQAAESVSCVDLFCILKGLHRSPELVPYPGFDDASILTAADVDCLVIPDRCLGIPTLAACAQGIPVIAINDDNNVLDNDLDLLPWAPGQLIRVADHVEAAGMLVAMRAGIPARALRRPLHRPEIIEVDAADTSPKESVRRLTGS